MSAEQSSSPLVELSGKKFMGVCVALSILLLVMGRTLVIPTWVVATEVFLTIIGLFIFGSIRYRLDKNALTYGAVLVIGSSFFWPWWNQSVLKQNFLQEGASSIAEFLKHYLLTLHGLDALFHADTMLFILGLTFFVAVIAQTRLLETISFSVLTKYQGAVLPTIGILTALVAAASGVLDGVSMIGLMIRTLVIILFLAKADESAVIYAVIVSTVVTTVCGMWLAYGEPPNLIMKANLHPHLDNAFFLRYCLPAAVGSYLIVFWNLRKRLKGKKIDMKSLDILDSHTADVRFLNAYRHGEVMSAIDFVDHHQQELDAYHAVLVPHLQKGMPLGLALHKVGVPEELRLKLLGEYVSEDLSVALDEHYADLHQGKHVHGKAEDILKKALSVIRKKRITSQQIGCLAFVPFIGGLVAHAVNHQIPLFIASMAAFLVAFTGIMGLPKIKKLALKEATHEYKEYLFLLPLFLSITLLQKTGFFNQLSDLIHHGIEKIGAGHVAYIQFSGAAFLSAMLDNNVVADFASRALHGLDITLIHLFSMAQIAGYAAGGCWTHIGSAQSVVAYSFIQKEVNARYTPFQWMKAMTPLIIQLFVLMIVIVYGEAALLKYLH